MQREMPTTDYNDPEIQAESALARAQSLIYIARTAGPKRPREISKILGVDARYLSRVCQGDYDLTVRELGKILAASGYRLTIGFEKIERSAAK